MAFGLEMHRMADCANWENASVLDVGCGSGYHLWRMWGAGARLVLGIDHAAVLAAIQSAEGLYAKCTGTLFTVSTRKTFQTILRALTSSPQWVFCICKSPFQHLEALRGALKKGGTLILETLIVEGPMHTVLVPTDRYAQMRNVWCILSLKTLCVWLERMALSIQ